MNRVREGKGTFGYNAATGDYGDMIAESPKDDEHSHGGPAGGGMGGMLGMEM